MTHELSQELILYLVEIGELQHFDNVEQIPTRFPYSRSGALMRLAPEAWYKVASSLSTAQLVALIKTLTVLEQRIPNFCSGSVSPVIWLFHKLSERSLDDLTPIIEWVLSHTNNQYLPFGTSNLGARSLAEFHALTARIAEFKGARQATEKALQLEAKRRKSAQASHKLFGALRRHDEKAVAALLSQGADVYSTNEKGQSALEYSKSVGLHHILSDK